MQDTNVILLPGNIFKHKRPSMISQPSRYFERSVYKTFMHHRTVLCSLARAFSIFLLQDSFPYTFQAFFCTNFGTMLVIKAAKLLYLLPNIHNAVNVCGLPSPLRVAHNLTPVYVRYRRKYSQEILHSLE